MSQIQSAPTVCPKCHQAMKLMLVKETGGRILRCVDCGQHDPMGSVDTQGWTNSDLYPPK